MQTYVIRRLLLLIPSFLIISLFVFFLLRFIPGSVVDAMMAQQESTTSELRTREMLVHELGLDVPVHIQYGHWMWGIISRGDIGTSLWEREPVVNYVFQRLPVSLELGILAIIIGQLVAIPIGVFSAIRQDTTNDYLGRTLAILFLSLPNFWLATMVMVYPSLWWSWAPPMEYIRLTDDPLGNLGMMIIPATLMGLHSSGRTMRMMRTTMLDVLRQDYIRTAWAKGLKERVVIFRHALKNALITVVTLVGLSVPIVIGGTVLIEQIFALPGMGRLLIDALSQRDYPVVSGVNLFFATFVLLTNLAVDLSYAYLDPRIHYK